MNQLYKNLCRVKALLVDGWGQDGHGLCLHDAAHVAFKHEGPERKAVYDALYDEVKLMGASFIVEWNDAPGRTKAEVVDLVQRAANRAAGGNAAPVGLTPHAAPVSTDANA